ncbi:hypothetical protein ACFFKU_11630 [Kineococcus gynurae]|uniref:Uncharacterized protein n=1 Tax=Kineococcus gynurae TaxID=452979 RepID=A0ABV5LRB3_9ACTN
MSPHETSVSGPRSAAAHPSEDDPASFSRAWHDALDELEVDVTAAEELLRQLHSGAAGGDVVPRPVWRAPELPGKLPADCLDRARALHQRQLDVSQRIARAMVQTRSQSNALRKMAQAEARPVFVDFAL